MQLLENLGVCSKGTASGTPSPRSNSPRSNSPRNNSPRTHSPRTEDSLTLFAKAKMPGTLHLVQRGQDSHYFKLIEKAFQLLNDLQFHCLPLKYRSLGIKHYIATETEKRREEMETLFCDWLDKEQTYIEELVGPLEKLPEEQENLIPCIRRSIFTALYHEQDERKKEDPFQPFLSICSIGGQKNGSYHASLMQAKMQQQTEKSHQEKIKKTNCLTDDYLQRKSITVAKLTEKEKQLVLATKIATTEARLKVCYDETQGSSSQSSASDIPFQFHLLAALSRGSPYVSGLANWEEIHTEYEALQAKQLADKKWADYSKKEEAVFEELHGFAYNSLSTKEKAFYNAVRAAIYRVIYEEQPGGLPFYSICNKEGELNEEYWIDRLDALAKKNKETPLEDHHALKHYTDYDVLRTNTAPPKTKADGITDDSRLRTPGAITPDFCTAVLANIKQHARALKERCAPKTGFIATSPESDQEVNKLLFNAQSNTTEEKILFFLNEYCEALAHTHYIRGLTQGMLTKMNIKVLLGQPSLSGMLPTELRKSRKSDADKTPGLLRKMSGSLVGKKLAIESPSLLRKSPNPETSTPAPPQSAQTEPEFEKECRLFQEELKAAHKISKLSSDERIPGSDESIEYFRIYAISLQIMGTELKKLGNMLQEFAASLQAQAAARQERNSLRTGIQNHRNSSLGLRAHKRPLLSEGTFEPPLRARSVSLMGHNTGIKSVAKTPPLAACSPVDTASSASSANASPPDSPRVADMNPEKFAEKADLLLKLHRLFMETHALISAEVEKASPDTLEAGLAKKLEGLNF